MAVTKLYNITYRCGHKESRRPTFRSRYSKADLIRFNTYLCPICLKFAFNAAIEKERGLIKKALKKKERRER
jgi:hypothetical protein